MRTCDRCLTGRHIWCQRLCACNLCKARARKPAEKQVRAKKPAQRSTRNRGLELLNERRFGVRSRLSEDVIFRILECKGLGLSKSEAARRTGADRRSVIKIYGAN